MSISNFDDMLALFSNEAKEAIADFENGLACLSRNPEDARSINRACRSMHSLKSSSGILTLRAGDNGRTKRLKLLTTLARLIEEKLSDLSDTATPVSPRFIVALQDVPLLITQVLDSNIRRGEDGIIRKIEDLHVLFETGELPTGQQHLSTADLDALFRADASIHDRADASARVHARSTARKRVVGKTAKMLRKIGSYSEEALDLIADEVLRGLEEALLRRRMPVSKPRVREERPESRVTDAERAVVEPSGSEREQPRAVEVEKTTGDAAMDALRYILDEEQKLSASSQSDASLTSAEDRNQLDRLVNLATELTDSRTRLNTEFSRLSSILAEIPHQGISLGEVDAMIRDFGKVSRTIGELSDAFDGMASRFDQSVAQIRAIAKTLHDEMSQVDSARKHEMQPE